MGAGQQQQQPTGGGLGALPNPQFKQPTGTTMGSGQAMSAGGMAAAAAQTAFAAAGSTGWMPGPQSRMYPNAKRDRDLEIWTRLLGDPHAANSRQMQPMAPAAKLQTLPVMPAIGAHFLAQFTSTGSAQGPVAWETMLRAWDGVWQGSKYVAPPPAAMLGYAITQHRIEMPIRAAEVQANAVVEAIQLAYTIVATSVYQPGFVDDFWTALPTMAPNVLAAVGCAVAERVQLLCETAGYTPVASSHEEMQSVFMRTQSTKALESAKASKDQYLAKPPVAALCMDVPMYEALRKVLTAANPHATVTFIKTMDCDNAMQVLQCLQMCQQYDAPLALRQGIMFYMKKSALQMYGALTPFFNFQQARMRRASNQLRFQNLAATDARMLALALSRPTSVGIRSPFHAAHRITTVLSKDAQMTLDDVCLSWTKEAAMIKQFGLTVSQPVEDYYDVAEELRMIQDELSSAETTVKTVSLVVTSRLRVLVTGLIKSRNDLVVRYADEFMARGAPYPTLYVAAHLRSALEHDPYFRDSVDDIMGRTRKIAREASNPVLAVTAAAKQAPGLVKMMAQSQTALTALAKHISVLTTAQAAGKLPTKAQQAAALAATKVAAATLKAAKAESSKAEAAATGQSVMPAPSPKTKKKGTKPLPPAAPPNTKVKFDAPEPDAETEEYKPQTIPPPRFKSKTLAPKAVGEKWEHPPVAYTDCGLSIPTSLLWDFYHDNKKNKGRRDLCYFDQCGGADRGCGRPDQCFQFMAPDKLKRHPNGDDSDARAATRTKWIKQVTEAGAKGYIGYGT